MLNFQRPIDDEPLDANQLLGEYYAMATNQVQPVQAQGFQPRLRTPYDISLQAQRDRGYISTESINEKPYTTKQSSSSSYALASSS